MGREKTGKPKQITTWEDTQYLDLERRQMHIPHQRITWEMLSEDLQREFNNLPIGYYSGDGSTFDVAIDEQGRVTFIPIYWGNGKYGMCMYGIEVGLYGTAKYGEASYSRVVIVTAEYGGTGGYGSVKYG